MTGFVLLEKLATRTRGVPIMFQTMTRIGPINTANENSAAKFETEALAKECPARSDALSFYDVVPFDQIGVEAAKLIGMSLQASVACGDCVHFAVCKAIFGHVETDTSCEWSPSRFHAKATGAQP